MAKLSPEAVRASELAGEPIVREADARPGNDAPIGGLKVVTANGLVRGPAVGHGDVYKIYAESFRDEAHLATLVDEARQIVQEV